MPVSPSTARVIVATDCGSTTTKAILIEVIDGVYRQTYRGEAPTTVEEPLADVTLGVVNALTELQELSGRPLIDAAGEIIRPARVENGHPVGCDIYISTSSAGGGLQMVVAGVVREMSAASAKRAALGAGAIVMETLAANDRRKPHEQIQRIRELRPDMILIAGGTDGGNVRQVVQIAERIAPAKPLPRFGGEYRMPVIYAGNREAAVAIPAAYGIRGRSADLTGVRAGARRVMAIAPVSGGTRGWSVGSTRSVPPETGRGDAPGDGNAVDCATASSSASRHAGGLGGPIPGVSRACRRWRRGPP